MTFTPYSVTPGSGLKIAAVTVVQGPDTISIPVITNQVVSISATSTGITTTAYSANQIMGTAQLNFAGVALKAGLGGVIQNVSLYCGVVSTGQYLLRLFDKSITTAITDKTAYSSFTLSDTEAQSFVGDIEFSFPLASANNTLYSVNGVSMAFLTDSAGSPNLYGVLLSRNGHTLTGAVGTDIRVNLEILL